jgi:hypothetical protein
MSNHPLESKIEAASVAAVTAAAPAAALAASSIVDWQIRDPRTCRILEGARLRPVPVPARTA